MNILQIDKYFYLKGGAETVFFNTIDLLKENGHHVVPFCLKSKKNRESEYSKYFVDFPELSESSTFTKIKNISNFFYNTDSVKKLETLIQNEKPDIAHIHLLFNGISVSILPLLKKHNIPIVMTVHDYRLICPAYTFRNGKEEICESCLKNKRYIQCFTNKCSKGNLTNSLLLSLDSYFRDTFYNPLDYIDKFIFVSKFSQSKHIEANIKYKEKSVHLYNFTSDRRTNIEEKKNYLLYIGRIAEEKGIQTLIKAQQLVPNVDIKIVGTGPLLNDLKKNYPNVSFLGFKEGKVLEQLIKEAKFTIVPSEWYENNPLSVIESMMSGTPVIGSNIAGIPELIKDKHDGFLFQTRNFNNLAEVIKEAISLSKEDYKKMSDSAYKFAIENFSKEAHYKRLKEIYLETISECK